MLTHVREQHHEPVDADPEAAGRRHPVLHGPEVRLVDTHRLLVTGGLGGAWASKR
jgi:hypothetical protein